MDMERIKNIAARFAVNGDISNVKPLGNGLINDTYLVETQNDDRYVLQRINTAVFPNPKALADNFDKITNHIRKCLVEVGDTDLEKKTLRGISTIDGANYLDADGEAWRMTAFIPNAAPSKGNVEAMSRDTGRAFAQFHSYFVREDAPALEETIVDFHNVPFRIRQLRDAVAADPVGRLQDVRRETGELLGRAEEMTRVEHLFEEGKLPKRVTHCDTKTDNILFDAEGKILCVIDLDTTMPGFVLSDFGDYMRTAGNTGDEDDKDLCHVNVNMDVFKAFAKGYVTEGSFLTPLERELLPHGAQRMAYMQAVRFLTDYINGDTYYKVKYPDHNLVRTRAQMKLLASIDEHLNEMNEFIKNL